MKIIFRADGNSATGLGHLYRLFALVEMLKQNYECLYITKCSSTIEVIPDEYHVFTIPENILIKEEPIWLAKQFNPAEHIIIADGYQFKSNYQKQIKTLGFKLIYIDDLTTEYMYADMVINHSPHVKKSDYKGETYTTFALGPKYAILRPSFLQAAKKNRTINEIDTVFLCFGGADPYDLSLKAVKAILKISKIREINVVLGGAYKHKEIFALANSNKENVNIYQNIPENELNLLLQKCNCAVVPMSTIFLEVISCKMVVFSGYFADNQEKAYQYYEEKKIMIGLKDLTKCEFKVALKKAENLSKLQINNFIEKQSDILDGNQKQRFLDALKKLSYGC